MPYSQTIETVRQTLQQTFDELDIWFDQSEEVRAYKPKDGGWSIDELLAHVTLTSHFLLIVIRNGAIKAAKRAARGVPIVGEEADLEMMSLIGHPDAFAWLRPEHMEPTRSHTNTAVRVTMREQQRECLEILARMGNGEGSLHKVRMSVQNLGKLDLYQWLYFLALHARRHLAQIESVWREQPQQAKLIANSF